MKIKWFNKTFTFMVIPEANSQVVRFRMSGWLLSLIASVIVLLVALTLTLYVIQSRNAGTNHLLQDELLGKTEQFEQTITQKNQTIERLQSELIRLAQQAEEVKGKIAELKKLEDEMKSLTGSTGADKPAASAAAAGQKSVPAFGVGGDALPVTEDDVRKLIAETESSYATLGEEMSGLAGSLTETKRKVQEAQHKLAITPTIWPTDSRTVTSGFGLRLDPFTRAPSFHNGLDISGKTNDPVYATAEGVVVSAGWDPTGGNNIIIDHTGGLRTRYMHLNAILVNKGDKVTKGQKIGLMGSTGRSTGTHLHYGVLKNGETVDPRPYLTASRKEEP